MKFPIHQFVDCLQTLVCTFGLSCLISFIPFPQTIPEAITFLSYPSCQQFETHFLQSVSILIHNFNSLTIEQLNCLCDSALIQIFSSDQLQIDNEDYLFSLIKQLIDKDSKKISLLKTLRFHYLSSNLVLDVFNKVPLDELDSDLFLILIQQMFTRTIQQDQPIRQYQNPNQIPLLEQNEQLKKEIENSKNENEKLNSENINFQNEIRNLQNRIEQLQQENQKLNTKEIPISGFNGIIS
jgi:hypothetical protein